MKRVLMIVGLCVLGGLALHCGRLKPAQTMEHLREPVVALLESRIASLAVMDPESARGCTIRAAAALSVLHDAKHALAGRELNRHERALLIAAVIHNADEIAYLLPNRPPWLQVVLEMAVTLTPQHTTPELTQAVGGFDLTVTDYAAWRDGLLVRHGLRPVMH